MTRASLRPCSLAVTTSSGDVILMSDPPKIGSLVSSGRPSPGAGHVSGTDAVCRVVPSAIVCVNAEKVFKRHA